MARYRDNDERERYRRSHSRYGRRSGPSARFEGSGRETGEEYFGGGLSYGEGYASSPRRLSEGYGGYGRSEPANPSGQTYYDESPPYYGRTTPDYDRAGYERRSRRSGFGQDPEQYYPPGAYRGYPESERGFMTDPEFYRGEERGWWDRTSDEVASWFGDEHAARRREMDERQAGYRGRGPRGYTRSDERIKEQINDELTDAYAVDAWDLDVQVKDGNVILSGTVKHRYEKRLAEDIAEDISGVKNVENHIRVNPTSTQDTTGQDKTTSATGRRSASA